MTDENERDEEIREITCRKKNRRAKLLVTWKRDGSDRKVQSVQCDDPDFQTIENRDCDWECWGDLERETTSDD